MLPEAVTRRRENREIAANGGTKKVTAICLARVKGAIGSNNCNTRGLRERERVSEREANEKLRHLLRRKEETNWASDPVESDATEASHAANRRQVRVPRHDYGGPACQVDSQ